MATTSFSSTFSPRIEEFSTNRVQFRLKLQLRKSSKDILCSSNGTEEEEEVEEDADEEEIKDEVWDEVAEENEDGGKISALMTSPFRRPSSES